MRLLNGKEWPLNTAYNGDCLEFMQQLPDKCIDLVLTDPPYGIGAGTKTFTREGTQTGKSKAVSGLGYKKSEWDITSPDESFFQEMIRISKHQIIWGINYYPKLFKSGRIVWDKNNGENRYSDCELAYQSFTESIRLFKYTWHGMIQENMKNKETRIHPTQKPLKLFKWCLEKYAPENAIVFDPFLGSFTTAVACHSHGLNWIGCEKDEDYFKAGQERYDTECLQNLMDFGS